MAKKSKAADRLVLLVYIAAALVYGIHTAVRCGVAVVGGNAADLRNDLRNMQLDLSDYLVIRSDAELTHLFAVNLLRGLAVLALLYIAMRLVIMGLKKLEEGGLMKRFLPKFEKKNDGEGKREGGGIPLFAAFRKKKAQDAPADDPFDEGRDLSAEKAAFSARRTPAARTDAKPKKDFFADLSAENDNVRVIVKLTQRDEDGELMVQFFCGDTLGLTRYRTTDKHANRSVGSGEIKQFVQKTRQDEDVFYVYDIRKAAQSPVMLYGEEEDAVRLLDRRILLRIYRQQMLFITPQLDIRTVESKQQEAAAVRAVSGQNNTASRTRSYRAVFYELDEGIEYEVEVRIKL